MMNEKLNKLALNKAVQLLAQRDHSIFELTQKLFLFLESKIPEKESIGQQIQSVIDYCIQHRWLNDELYTEKYIEMRSQKGFGKYKIAFELKQRGLTLDMIDDILYKTDIDWTAIAIRQIRKKFPKMNKQDIKQKYKITQFLLYRGFTQEEIKYAYHPMVNG